MHEDKREERPGRAWDVEEGKEDKEGSETLNKNNSNGLVRGWKALRLKLLPPLWEEPGKPLLPK